MPDSKLKMCRNCRGLIAAGVDVCPLCGTEAHFAAPGLSTISPALTVTGAIFTANLIFYALSLLVTMRLADGEGGFTLEPGGLALRLLGDVSARAISGQEFWRLITYAFLHGGIIHILFNSLALIQVGRLAEEVYGGAKYFCLYIVSAITGGLMIAVSDSVAVGASGAIFGLIGAMAVYGFKRGDTYGRALKTDMVQWLIYGVIISFLPGISFAGHLGGLIGGAAMAWFLADEVSTLPSQRWMRIWQLCALVCLVLTIGSFALAGLSIRRNTEINKLDDFNRKIQGAIGAYLELPDESLSGDQKAVDEIRGRLGAAITSLEQANEPDREGALIRDQMLAVLRERKEMIRAGESAPKDQLLENLQQMSRLRNEYDAWLTRRAAELKVGLETVPRENRRRNRQAPEATQAPPQ
jgi:rhomboid protease GluP